MNNITIKITLLLGLMILSLSAYSQEETNVKPKSKFLGADSYLEDHLSFWAGFGAPAVTYDNNFDMGKSAFSLTLGGEYKYSLFNRVSLSAGLEYNYAANDKSFGSITLTKNEIDIQDDPFIFRSKITNYKEDHVSHNIGIPIKISYEFPASETSNIYLAGGFKFAVPVYTKYKMEFDNLSTSGYYPQWEVVYESDLPEYGFYDFGGASDKGKLGLKPYISVLAEAGITFPLTENGQKLHFGLFMDYGLNSVSKKGNKKLVEYYADGTKGKLGKYNMLQTNVLENMRFVSFGFKVSYSFPYNLKKGTKPVQ